MAGAKTGRGRGRKEKREKEKGAFSSLLNPLSLFPSQTKDTFVKVSLGVALFSFLCLFKKYVQVRVDCKTVWFFFSK